MSELVRVRPDWLAESMSQILGATGVSSAAARTVAESLVDADLRGVPSHGAMLLPMYVDRLVAGSVATHEKATVVTDLGAVAVLDANNALGQLTADQAMQLAIDKAKKFGIGAVAVRNAFHFGGAYRYAQAAAAAGCIGIAMANTRPLMPAPGGAKAVVGNNPVAVSVPVDGELPLTLDMALSEAALGKIRLAEQAGKEIPPTWATDAEGMPTTDPTKAIAGLLLPMAGPKGYGLALVVDLLAGVLSGGGFGAGVKGLYADTSQPNNCAQFFLALNIETFGNPADFAARVARLVDEVRSSPTAPGVDRVLLPGQLEAERAQVAASEGILMDPSVIKALQETAGGVGVVLDNVPSGEGHPA